MSSRSAACSACGGATNVIDMYVYMPKTDMCVCWACHTDLLNDHDERESETVPDSDQ